jgi:ABC-type bacteriocin/lantibiotic exporter with double-glycine peptidase domain
VTSHAFATLIDGVLVVAYLAVLLGRSPAFALILATLVGIEIAIFAVLTPRLRSAAERELAAGARSQGALVETVTGIETIKASGVEARALARWRERFERRLELSAARGRLVALLDAAHAAVRVGTPLLLLWLGVWQVLDGRMTAGEMLGLTLIAAACLNPLTGLAISAAELQAAAAHAERIADVLEATPERPGPDNPVKLAGRVAVQELSFRYSATGPLVLQDVSFAVSPGQMLAVIGLSGSGKSTLLSLLLGLYEPSAGDVLFDGRPLGSLPLGPLRRRIGTVPQQVALIAGTVADNLRLGAPGASDAELIAAARLAELHDEIARLPIGYDTWIGDGGQTLSGGQRQRLALARALVGKPDLLLLDEATSHLDVTTEARILANLAGLGLTRIVVAHRASVVRQANLVVVLRDGEVVETGSPAELIARGGFGATLLGDGRADAPAIARDD